MLWTLWISACSASEMENRLAGWKRELLRAHGLIAGLFARSEARGRSLAYLQGLLSGCERKNGWQMAEWMGEASPYAMQHLLGIGAGNLTLHADRGTSMTSKPVALLLADLGVTRTHSRPHLSDDNPYSEGPFKTLKYRPEFPRCFGSIEDARAFCQQFFAWYNREHRHSGIALLTPETLHYGLAEDVIQKRQQILNSAYAPGQSHFKIAPEAGRGSHRPIRRV